MLMSWISGGMPVERDETKDPARTGGLLAGTMVATDDGWKTVESLCVGDMVMTFDDGLQPVTGVSRALYPAHPDLLGEAAPLLCFPAGLFGNSSPLTVAPNQPLVVESDLSEVLYGDPFAPVEAGALTLVPGVEQILPEAPVVVVSLGFESDQIIFAQGNALVLCPAAMCFKPQDLETAIFAASEPVYKVLDGDEARMVAAGLIGDVAGSGRAVPEQSSLVA